MKRHWTRLTAALCALLLLVPAALARSEKEKTPWVLTPMTVEEMEAIYQESCEKMGTTYELNLMTIDELPEWERSYTEQTGLARKEDLVISTVPGIYDLPYDRALTFAKQAIMDKFGTPETELDTMGVYPRFMDFVYMDNESEWEFIFSPRRNIDIRLDHAYEAPGEYFVTFGAQSMEVQDCFWYIDEFWPEYAQRTWNACKRDVVYERAQRADFYEQSQEEQAHFVQLLTDAGYELEGVQLSDEELLSEILMDLMYADPGESVLHEDDPNVRTALKAMERFGLYADRLDRYAYVALYSPVTTGTTDICFAYNYNIESAMYESGELNAYTGMLFSYIKRLGLFMVKLDPETGEGVGVVHIDSGIGGEKAAGDALLSRRSWTVDDANEYDALMDELRMMAAEEPESIADRNVLRARVHALMREAGGDPELYNAREETAEDIGIEAAVAIAIKAVQEATGMDDAVFAKAYMVSEHAYEPNGTYYVYICDIRSPTPTEDDESYMVVMDAATGEVHSCDIFRGNG